MSSSKYIVYRCNVCDRRTEILLDGRRIDPIRCNITLDCRGKLQREGERAVRQFLFTPIVPDLLDFIPRGTPINPAPQLTVPNPITVFTAAGSGIIALSAVRKNVVSGVSNFSVTDSLGGNFLLETVAGANSLTALSEIKMVLFEISPELLTTNKYTYVINGPVAIISGPDDSPDGKNLRFSSSNQLTVFVNGVLVDPTGYDRTVNDQITFTPTIFDTNNVVEIFVYKDISSAIGNSKQVVLTFRSLSATIPGDVTIRELNCWGNFGATIIGGTERFILYCTDLGELRTDKSYGVAYFEAYSVVSAETKKLDPAEMFIILGKEPFSFVDKEYYAYLSGTSLVTDRSIMTYKESDASGALFLTVDESSITQLFNQIKVSRKIASIQTIAEEDAIEGTALEGTENLTPKFILGPI